MLYSITSFDGINQVVSPYKVPDNIGTEFINIDTTNKTLKNVKDVKDTTTSMEGNSYWYKAPNYDIKTNSNLSLSYLNGYIYTTSKGKDTNSVLTRWDATDNSTSTVGISIPTATISITDTGDYYSDADFTYAYYFYAVTYFNSDTGEESEPLLSEVFGATRKTRVVNLSSIDTTASDKLRIYRVGNYITKFTLVDELDNNSASVTYNDDKPDTSLTILLNTKGTITPPVGLNNLVMHQGSFYASKGSRLRFSKPGNASAWEALSFIDMEADIEGLASINGVLLIFLRNKVMTLVGTDYTNFELLSLMSDVGLVDVNTLATFRNFVVFLTDNGLCITDGGTVRYVTKDIYEFPEGLVYKDSTVLTDRYFLLTDQFLYEMDFSQDTAPMFKLYDNVSGTNSITGYTNTLYGCRDTIVEFFNGTEDLTFKYKTKDIVAPGYNYIQELNKVSITAKGDILSKINVNNDIINKNLNSINTTLFDAYVPTEANDALTMSVELEGVGEVYAINFDYDIPEQAVQQ